MKAATNETVSRFKDVMIDFETFGNGKDKCICQVGAVYFDKTTGELGPSFKANIDAASHVRAGAKIDAETVYWWLSQSDAARASVCQPGRDVTEVMKELNEFLRDASRVWSHATFDFVTLTDTLKSLGIKQSFSYKAAMDIRTLVYLSGLHLDDFKREGTHHDGLADAIHQVRYTVAALNLLKGNKQTIATLSRLLEVA